MDDLNPRTRALLDAARGFDDPTNEDQERVHSAVLLRIGGAAAIGTAAITAAKTSSAAASAAPLIASGVTTTTIFSGLVAKVGVAVVLAGAVASGAYVALRPAHRIEAPVVAIAPTANPIAEVAPPAPAAAPAPAADPEPAAVDANDLPTDDAKPSPSRSARAHSPSLEGEMKLLRSADAALRRGDSASALAALNRHAQLYPSGELSQEREGMRAIALCAGGNLSQGQSSAQRFLAHAAKSPLASRIRSACSLGE
ncbi:MAG TPA: hypothetical protein VHV51_17540 [Polyangiaceae bacterium]|jgi:hypothetical protein|nr:hypothetical protein [Polyangiaceae bacterium]